MPPLRGEIFSTRRVGGSCVRWIRRSTVHDVTATHLQDGPTQQSDVETVRLRVGVYLPIAVAKGYDTAAKQAKWHGIAKSTMHRLLAGHAPLTRNAARIARDCGVPMEALWDGVA